MLKLGFFTEWIKRIYEYFELEKEALKFFIIFATSYLCKICSRLWLPSKQRRDISLNLKVMSLCVYRMYSPDLRATFWKIDTFVTLIQLQYFLFLCVLVTTETSLYFYVKCLCFWKHGKCRLIRRFLFYIVNFVSLETIDLLSTGYTLHKGGQLYTFLEKWCVTVLIMAHTSVYHTYVLLSHRISSTKLLHCL